MVDPRTQPRSEWVAELDGKPPPNVSRLTPTAEIPQAPNPRMIAPSDAPVLIPEGEYSACCHGYRYGDYWDTAKVRFEFEIVKGKHSGEYLERFYNLKKKKGRDGVIYQPPARGNYMRMIASLFPDEAKQGMLDPDLLVGKVFKVEVATVSTDYKKRPLGESRYSRITSLLSLEDE